MKWRRSREPSPALILFGRKRSDMVMTQHHDPTDYNLAFKAISMPLYRTAGTSVLSLTFTHVVNVDYIVGPPAATLPCHPMDSSSLYFLSVFPPNHSPRQKCSKGIIPAITKYLHFTSTAKKLWQCPAAFLSPRLLSSASRNIRPCRASRLPLCVL